MGARAMRVTDAGEMAKIGRLMLEKFPRVADYAVAGMEDIALFHVVSEFVSVLDYRQGFGHTELVKVA